MFHVQHEGTTRYAHVRARFAVSAQQQPHSRSAPIVGREVSERYRQCSTVLEAESVLERLPSHALSVAMTTPSTIVRSD